MSTFRHQRSKGTPNRKGVVRKVAMALEEEYDKGFQRAKELVGQKLDAM